MFHFQNSTTDWTSVIGGDPPLCIKAIDRGDILREARQHNPNTFTILRHWQNEQHFGGGLEENRDRARAFFQTFIDGTFRQQYAQYVDAIEELNEYLANSQTAAEVDARVMWAEACA